MGKWVLMMAFLSVAIGGTGVEAQRRRRATATQTGDAPTSPPASSSESVDAGSVAGVEPANTAEPATTTAPAAESAAAPAEPVRQESAARTQARAQYAEGQRLFQAGDYRGAERSFRSAYESSPSPLILLGIAAAQERRGMPGATRRTLQQYLTENPNAADRAAVESRIAALTPTSGTVVVSGSAGAALFVDGEARTETIPATLTLEDGDHVVRAELAGHTPNEATIEVTENSNATIELTLADAPVATPAETEPVVQPGSEELVPEPGQEATAGPSTAVWVATAVAGVGLLAGTIFGFTALNEQSNFDLRPSAAAADRGETFAMLSDITFAVAAGAGITALVLYFTDRPSAPTTAASDTNETSEPTQNDGDGSVETPAPTALQLHVVPTATPTAGGLTITGRF